MSTEPTVLSKRFSLGDRIAAGGMACVYAGETVAADDPLAGRPLAIKVLHEHLAENADFVRMFRDEGSIAARFEHTHVVRVHAVGEDKGRHYLVMDRIFGHNLAEVLIAYRKRRRRIPKAAAFDILRQVLSALVYVHGFKGKSGRRLEIVHRDISPHNILIAVDEKVRLTDFGIARGSHRTQQTRTGTIKGKLHYMSPEQARGKRVDKRADLYALGAVAWELFTERPLLQADRTEALQARVMAGEFDLKSPKFDALPDDLQEWLRKSLAVDVADRWRSAESMLAALGAVRGASTSRFKPGTLKRLLALLDEPEKPEQAALLSDAEMEPRRYVSSAEAASAVIRTPQRPISRVFVGPEVVSGRRLSRADRLKVDVASDRAAAESALPSDDELSPASMPRRRASRSSARQRSGVETHRAAPETPVAPALSLRDEDEGPAKAAADEHRRRASGSRSVGSGAGERVSRVLVHQQRGVALAGMVAGACVALLLFGTLLEVWNARLHLPQVDEHTFEGILADAMASASSTDDSATEESAAAVDEAAEEDAARDNFAGARAAAGSAAGGGASSITADAAPTAARHIRNDRFLPRATRPVVAKPSRKAKPQRRVKPARGHTRSRPAAGVATVKVARKARKRRAAARLSAKNQPRRRAQAAQKRRR